MTESTSKEAGLSPSSSFLINDWIGDISISMWGKDIALERA